MVVQNAADRSKRRVASLYPDGGKRSIPVERGTIHAYNVCRQFKSVQAAAIGESKITDLRQGIARKCYGR